MSRGITPWPIVAKLIRVCLSFFSSETRKKIVVYLAQLSDIELLPLTYNDLGILKFEDANVSGERYLIDCVLKNNIKKPSPIFFDVGANVGRYSRDLLKAFPSAKIYAFEPNPAAFDVLVNAVRGRPVECVNAGCSSSAAKLEMFTYTSGEHSGHASLYKEVFSDLHKRSDVAELDVDTVSLDDFCRRNGITSIDFIKIDTEGHELEVLKGARDMLAEKKIPIIQFEFNEINVISRVFLRDFYNLLSGYNFYRLDTKRLIPLFAYDSANEIFKFQNLLAVSATYPFDAKCSS